MFEFFRIIIDGEIDAICNNTEAPSFANTIEALEYSGALLYKETSVFYNLTEAVNSPELEKMREAWDNSMLRRSSLTLMGMYIAKICIRETIGEDFDLSHWM